MQSKEEGKIFTPEESTEILTFIAQNMATKQDLTNLATELRSEMSGLASKKDLKASEQRVMDHTMRECAKLRGDLISSLRKEDEKADEHIRTNEGAGVFNTEESARLQHLGPFPKLA